MKIVVLEGYPLNTGDLSWDELRTLGDVDIYDRTEQDQIIERANGADAILTNKLKIDSNVMLALPKLRYIGVLATGYNVVDLQAAKNLGITVTNVPTYGTQAVAQHVFALLLAMTLHVEEHSARVREGAWSDSGAWSFWLHPLSELSGKTMGIVGYGRIGRAVGDIARAFGMKVLANDSVRDLSLEADGMKYADLDELLAESDVISLHCPLLPENVGMINEKSISRMKDGVRIINTSRGQLIVEADLAKALDAGKVGAAGLDVLCEEPPKAWNPLFKAKNALITPHMAWAPKESRQRLLSIAVDNLARFIEGKPTNVVSK